MIRRRHIFALLLCFSLLCPVNALSAEPDRALIELPEATLFGVDSGLYNAIQNAAAFLLDNPDAYGADTWLALYASGIVPDKGPSPAASVLDNAVLLLTQGKNPHVYLPSLSAALIDYAKSIADSPDKQIQALQCLPYLLPARLYDRAEILARLTASQNADGSFSAPGESTQLLTMHTYPLLTDPDAKELSRRYLELWERVVGTEAGCGGAAALLSAAVSSGSEALENLVDNLLAYQTLGGGFRENDTSEPSVALTAAALTALCEAASGMGVYETLPYHYYIDEDEANGIDALNAVSLYGLLCGDGEGYFAPGRLVSRAEFAQILWNLRGGEAEPVALFDVSQDAWYAPAVGAALSYGYMLEGTYNFHFRPNEAITQQETVSALAAVLELDTQGALDALERGVFQIDGWEAVPESQRPAVAALCYEGVMDWSGNPDDPLRRDALAEILYKVIS